MTKKYWHKNWYEDGCKVKEPEREELLEVMFRDDEIFYGYLKDDFVWWTSTNDPDDVLFWRRLNKQEIIAYELGDL